MQPYLNFLIKQFDPQVQSLLDNFWVQTTSGEINMASKVIINNVGVNILVLMTMLWGTSMAQQSDCNNVLISMAPCLNYISGSSSTPSSSCCSQLTNVVQKDPQCLCLALNGGGRSLGININKTLALTLPRACNVQTPPVSRCDGNYVPY